MMNHLAGVVAAVLVAAPAIAQPPAVGAGVNAKALPTVFVEDDRGAETKGQLLRIDTESILVLVDGQARQFELANVRRVQKQGDSIKNGALIGALFGAVMGVLSGGMAGCKEPDGGSGPCGAGTRIAATLTSAGVFAAAGTGIDAMIQGRSTIYRKPPISTGLVSRGPAASLRVTLRW